MYSKRLIEDIFEFDSKADQKDVFSERTYQDIEGLNDYFKKRLAELGFTKMTKIQSDAFDAVR